MPYYGYRRRWRSYSRRNISSFSRDVANMDAVVKAAFFSLQASDRAKLFRRYEQEYGKGACSYAKQTISKWEHGQVGMSEDISKRLFKPLPPLMSVDEKYKIVEAIWKNHSTLARSIKYVRIGPDANPESVLHAIGVYFDGLNIRHAIPERLAAEFNWLAAEDVAVRQQLLNHFMVEQRRTAMTNAALNLDMLLRAFQSDTESAITAFSHTIIAGEHQVEIISERARSGFVFSDMQQDPPKPPEPTVLDRLWGPLIFALIIAGIFTFCVPH